jgi:phospholipase/carboxylesterase
MLETELIAATRKDSRRLMIVLHGLGDSIEGYRWLPEALELPGLNYLLVNAPDSYFGGYSWYDFETDPAPGVDRSRRLLAELLDTRRGEGFPTEQTFLFGFSQGALMALEIGCRYPHRLAGLIAISGYAFEPERLVTELSPVAKQQRFLITHGYNDPIIPFAKAREHARILKAAGLDVTWHEFAKAHTIAGEAEIKVIRDFAGNG